MSYKKHLIIIGLITAFAVICTAAVLSSQYNNRSGNISQTYALGEAEEKGYIGVELTYDAEVPDIILRSPSGTIYNKETAHKYDENGVSKTVTMLIDSGETGKWSISFNKGENKSISYKMINKLSPTLYLMDTEITKTGENYYIMFRPVQYDNTRQTCKYTLTLETDGHTFSLSDGKAKINEPSYIQIIVPKEAYDKETGNIKITVKSLEQTPQIAFKEIPVNLIENEISAADILAEQLDE